MVRDVVSSVSAVEVLTDVDHGSVVVEEDIVEASLLVIATVVGFVVSAVEYSSVV